jgi:hypothetical protein
LISSFGNRACTGEDAGVVVDKQHPGRDHNLGGDATLIVPREQADVACYPHLAAFVRGAPLTQQHDLLQKTGAALAQRLRDTPIWVSTSGLGVSWLHVRLDSRPKYYTYTPYKRFEG